MGEQRRILTIVATHDGTADAPSVADVVAAFVSDPNSLSAYLRENTEGWFDLSTFDVVGPYALMLPPPPDLRANTIAAAKAAAAAAGVDTGRYDGFVVVLHPGVVGGVGYDGGTSGNACTGRSSDDLTFYCHEVGHVLGFEHSYGLPNAGADWSDDGITQLSEVYGDPYDLMSSAAFGGGSPTTTLPGGPVHGMAGIRQGGPMLARAQLHFTAPGALEATGMARHLRTGDDGELVTLYSAGHGVPGQVELVVFSPDDEDAQGRGRVYVELRVPSPSNYRSRWDAGITAGANDLDRAGVVVHVVKDVEPGGMPAVWYAARIVFPTPDADVSVDTPRGPVVVSLSADQLPGGAPPSVRVRVGHASAPRVSLTEQHSDEKVVLSSEQRPIPGWDFAGTFAWERRAVRRTSVYTPAAVGLGGAGPVDSTSALHVRWYVGGYQLVPDTGTAERLPAGAPHAITLSFTTDPATGVLTCSNEPTDGAYVLPVQVSVSDEPTWRTPITADSSFEAAGIEEGWGEDYQRFMDFWDRITHPIPQQRFRRRGPEVFRRRGEELVGSLERLGELRPDLAQRFDGWVNDQVRVLARMAQQG